jgi:hypothetical protein
MQRRRSIRDLASVRSAHEMARARARHFVSTWTSPEHCAAVEGLLTVSRAPE